jgi:hypothetical protein
LCTRGQRNCEISGRFASNSPDAFGGAENFLNPPAQSTEESQVLEWDFNMFGMGTFFRPDDLVAWPPGSAIFTNRAPKIANREIGVPGGGVAGIGCAGRLC